MPPPSCNGRVILFSWSKTNFRLSVCLYHDLQTNSGTLFLIFIFDVIQKSDFSQRALQTNGKLFSHFKFVFEIIAENRKLLKQITRLEY